LDQLHLTAMHCSAKIPHFSECTRHRRARRWDRCHFFGSSAFSPSTWPRRQRHPDQGCYQDRV